MIDDKKIYVVALEKGISSLPNGISLDEMISYLKTKNHQLDGAYLQYFKAWFYTSFFVEGAHSSTMSENAFGDLMKKEGVMATFNTKKAIITGAAFFNYIDYIEVNEARQFSKSSTCWAIIAIVVAILTGGVQIWLALRGKTS